MFFQHFDWDLTHQVLFLYIYFAQPSYELERPALENAHTLVQRTDIFSWKFSAKVSLMLENPFLVSSLCKLNHISLCFIQISTKSPAKLLIPFRESTVFWIHPQCFGLFRKFQHNIKISIKRAHVSDYSFLVRLWLCLSCWPLSLLNKCKYSQKKMSNYTSYFWYSLCLGDF